MQIKYKKLHKDAITPQYATAGSACLDIYVHGCDWYQSAKDHGIHIPQGQTVVLETGLAFEIPEDHVMLIFSRSGHGFKNNTRLANCVGVIDSDYRGELKVKLTVDTSGGIHINAGDRIAQALVIPYPRLTLQEVNELSTTERGTGGLGSTGA